MNKRVKRGLIGLSGLLLFSILGAGAFVFSQVSAFDASMDKVYGVALSSIRIEANPETLARGKHLTHSLGGCASYDCHGPALSGGKVLEVGPLGTFTGPNITPGGLGAVYSEAEIARLVRHGIKKDGRSVRFMPTHEFNWLPEADLAAMIAYVKSVPAVEKPNGMMHIGVMGKVLDRQDRIKIDVARRIDHQNIPQAPAPSPTAAYGKYIALMCTGCHGETFGGGPIPGAPSELPVPANITPHRTGLEGWTFADFEKLLDTGIKKNGKKLDPFMPLDALTEMNEIERKALWEHLKSLPEKEYGAR